MRMQCPISAFEIHRSIWFPIPSKTFQRNSRYISIGCFMCVCVGVRFAVCTATHTHTHTQMLEINYARYEHGAIFRI